MKALKMVRAASAPQYELSALPNIEVAGMNMEDLAGSRISCFVGCFTADYSSHIGKDMEDVPMYHSTGNGSSILSHVFMISRDQVLPWILLVPVLSLLCIWPAKASEPESQMW